MIDRGRENVTLTYSLWLFVEIVVGVVGICTLLFQFPRGESLPGAIGAGIGLTLLDRWHRKRQLRRTSEPEQTQAP
jgi:hypothetical protein